MTHLDSIPGIVRLPRMLNTIRPATSAPMRATDARFICIARQTGVGVPDLAMRLVQALDAITPDGPRWGKWESELVEKIAGEMGISSRLIEQSEGRFSWIDDFIAGLGSQPDHMAIFHHLSDAIRGLARGGRAVMVGHGSHFVCRNMPGGIHVRLVAPWEERVRAIGQTFNLTPPKAEHRLRELRDERLAFIRRFWPEFSLDPETFAATLNAATLSEDRLVAAIVALVPAMNHA